MSTCQAHDELRNSPRTVVTVNGVVIPYGEIAREVQYHPAPSPVQAWKAAARALAVRTLLLEQARRLRLVPAPLCDEDGSRETDEEALIRQVIEIEVTIPKPSHADCQRYFEQNRGRFRAPALCEVSHILFSASKSDAETYENQRQKAEVCIDSLANNLVDFAVLARDVSDCPSAAQGGNLGQISPGQTTPAFEAAIATMTPGQISPQPVESPYGIHIIHLQRRIEGRDLPFDVVSTRIANYLTTRVEHTATGQYLARLAAAADIVGVDMPDTQDLRVF